MSAAFGNREDVMHLIGGSHPTILIALLTEGVGSVVSVTDTFPRSAVFFMDVRGAFILVILSPFLHSMFLAVLSIRKVWTAGVGAGTLGLARHLFTSIPGIKKSP